MGKYSDMFFNPKDMDLFFGKKAKKQVEAPPIPSAPEPEQDQAADQPGIKVTHKYGFRNFARKASSEHALEQALDWHFQEGDCYHCFSFGDVDSFSFFKHVLRQQRIKYAAISTWVIAGEDVKDLSEWYDRGMIGRVDFYIGEIFQNSYPYVFEMLKEFEAKCGGRFVIFRNHSKVTAILGERFDCLIESSENMNRNPRSENTVVTVDRSLVREYIKLFSEIVPYNRDDYGAEPYEGWKTGCFPNTERL